MNKYHNCKNINKGFCEKKKEWVFTIKTIKKHCKDCEYFID